MLRDSNTSSKSVWMYTVRCADRNLGFPISLDIQSYLVRFGVLGMFRGSKYHLSRCLDAWWKYDIYLKRSLKTEGWMRNKLTPETEKVSHH